MTQTSLRNVTQMSKNQRGPSDHESLNMQEKVRQRAYELYEERGRHVGRELEDWIQAEQEVRDKFGLRRAA
jgi:Protein of unknown function (DUF2934)